MKCQQTQQSKPNKKPASPAPRPHATSAKTFSNTKPRKNQRRALGRDKRTYHFIDEVADLTGTSERTIRRDIDDGRLIATYFRDTCRIADDDLKRYLRQQRGPRQLMKRRRSPRTKSKANDIGETQ